MRPHQGRTLFGAYLGFVMAHFVVDAGLWRMRDLLARAFLTAHLPFLQAEGRQEPQTGNYDQATDPSLADIGCVP